MHNMLLLLRRKLLYKMQGGASGTIQLSGVRQGQGSRGQTGSQGRMASGQSDQLLFQSSIWWQSTILLHRPPHPFCLSPRCTSGQHFGFWMGALGSGVRIQTALKQTHPEPATAKWLPLTTLSLVLKTERYLSIHASRSPLGLISLLSQSNRPWLSFAVLILIIPSFYLWYSSDWLL